VEFTPDEQYNAQCLLDLSSGRRLYTDLRRALNGGMRGLQFQFQELENLHREQIATTLLWKRWDSLFTALERLSAIKADPEAGRAARDHMLPAFEGIDRWVPLPVRHLLADWSQSGAVQVEQIELPDRDVRDRHARQVIAQRWVATSPLRRAASNAVAYLEAQGSDAHAVHLHGQDVDKPDTPYFISFQWRYAASMHNCLTRWGGLQWLEVPHPTLRQPITGILTTVRDRTVLESRPARP
jgi:hypothetical protein